MSATPPTTSSSIPPVNVSTTSPQINNGGTSSQKISPTKPQSNPNVTSSAEASTNSTTPTSSHAAQHQPNASNNATNTPHHPRDTPHAWEAVDGSSMWTDVQEDAEGNILLTSSSAHLSIAAQIRQRRHRLDSTDLARSSKRLVRHMLRHVYLVLDVSRWSREKDLALPPARTRLETILNLSREFVEAFYDENPLGHLGVVLVRDGEGEMLVGLGGSPRKVRLALGAALVAEMKRGGGSGGGKGKGGGGDGAIGGEFSLQNGIEVAGRSLGYAPRYGSREIIVVTSALATCDPGDMLGETLPRLLHAGIRVSTVALQAELHICRKLAEATGGLAGVCLDMRHLRDLVMGHAIPPPVTASQNFEEEITQILDLNGENPMICEFVTMGFPSREGGNVPTLVHCTGGVSNDASGEGGGASVINPATADDRRSNRLIAFARTGYVCPRCESRCSDLPSNCAVCGLRLILAPHLARTFHHLFPVIPFVELDEANVISKLQNDDAKNADNASSMNGGTISGKKGLDALPVLSSSAFTPIFSISSSTIGSFMVTSSSAITSMTKGKEQSTQHHSSSNTPSSKAPSSKIINIGPSILANSTDCDRCCFACLKVIGCKPLNTSKKRKGSSKSGPSNSGDECEVILRFQCPECHNVFCPDCDAYLHETLHNCPGCLCL